MPFMAKHVVHISEAEAASNFADVLARVRAGIEVVIEVWARPCHLAECAGHCRPRQPKRTGFLGFCRLSTSHQGTLDLVQQQRNGCFRKCAGDSSSSLQVRGCLACEHNKGTNMTVAHARCYAWARIYQMPGKTIRECLNKCCVGVGCKVWGTSWQRGGEMLKRILLGVGVSWVMSVTLGIVFAMATLGGDAPTLPAVLPMTVGISSLIALLFSPLAAWAARTGPRNFVYVCPSSLGSTSSSYRCRS